MPGFARDLMQPIAPEFSVPGDGRRVTLHPRSSMFRLTEGVFVVFTLFLFSDALVLQLRREAGFTSGEAVGDPVMQVIWLIVYSVTFCLVALEYRMFIRALLADKLVLLLLLLSVCSIAWSPAPPVTARRVIGLAGTTAFGVYLAMRYPLQEWVRLLATALGLVAVLSLAFVVLLPAYGVHHGDVHEGLWRGVFTGKNHLGRVMALGLTTTLLAASGSRRHRGAFGMTAALSALLLIKAGSMTAFIGVMITGIVLLAVRTVQARASMAVPGAFLAAATTFGAGAWALAQRGQIAALLGRDLTLTGRLPLWLSVWNRILARPMLGYGFGTFWINSPETAQPVWSTTYALNNWMPISAHNGVLDLWLAVGAIGVGIFVLGTVRLTIRGLIWMRQSRTTMASWPIAFLTLLMVANAGESSLFRQNNVYWAVYVALSGSVGIMWKNMRFGSRGNYADK